MSGRCLRCRHPGFAGTGVGPGTERGAGTVLIAMVAVLVAVAMMVALWLAGWVGCRHRAGHGADLAALAGAQAHVRGDDACAAAGRRAADNAVRMTSCHVEGGLRDFLVRVQVQTPLTPAVGGRARWITVEAVAGSLAGK